MRSIILVVAAALAAVPALAQDDPERRLSVSGEGRVEAAPDMATVQLGVTTEAPGAREAIDTNSRAMSGVLRRLGELGIAERDLQTSNFTVQPRWTREDGGTPPKLSGFVARNMLTVRVRDLSALGEVLDAVARDGANSYEGLSFGLLDPVPVEDAARRAAVADARRKAELYAEAAGVGLGELLTLSESGGSGGPMPIARAEMAMAADSVPVAPGELTVSARVSLVYALGDGG